MEKSKTLDVDARFEAGGQRFEAEVDIIQSNLGIDRREARILARTMTGINSLAIEVAEIMGAQDESEAEQIALQMLKDPNRFGPNMKDSELHRASLGATYLLLKKSAANVQNGHITSALSSVVELSGGLVRTIRNMADDSRSKAGTHAANASHWGHKANKQKAIDWYTKNPGMTKDAAAAKMFRDNIVPASFRTIRGYLTGL